MGILSSSNHRTYAFWEDTFTFKNSDGNIITIKKSQSYCVPKEVINLQYGEYGTEYKTFSIYPLCVFKGTLKTFAGLTYSYENSKNCSSNEFICKAAGQFGLLNNYWSKKENLEKKIKKEIDEFNKDFNRDEYYAKQILMDKELTEYRLKEPEHLREGHSNSRLNCLHYVNVFKETGIDAYLLRAREVCASHYYRERLLIKKGIPLPHPSIISQISEKYIDFDNKPTGYIDHLGDAILEDY